ncbi:PilZ domain-containing protein [Actinoplanes flavus]|uniref:PilZ domain-containing protein n=1 Tax=Actinoplanes flavus TaxID=2820290 RepID=A0ABS3UYH6_9ACTN|nr:PilZ domain-containing protein [Actinoplanes flavus]MBO3743635.1 PilZ domain-containing protein [Actinoplanes flavus]
MSVPAAEGAPPIEAPEIGTTIFLAMGEGLNLRSKLQGIEDGALIVTAPLETTGLTVFQPGREFEIFWALPRTRIVLPCRLIALSDSPPRWTLVPAGGARHDNRREFVRGGAGAVVRLDTEADDGQPAEGVLLDISEGGLRCWIDQPTTLSQGDRVEAAVWLGAAEARLNGVVHTIRPAPHGDPGEHLILRFGAKEDVARLIRQYILAWEIGERRRAGGV